MARRKSNPSDNLFAEIARTDGDTPTAQFLAMAFVVSHDWEQVAAVLRGFEREHDLRGGTLTSWLSGFYFNKYDLEEIRDDHAWPFIEGHSVPRRRRR